MKALLIGILMTIVIGSANRSVAQSEIWSNTIGMQLSDGIESESPVVKTRAIQTAHNYALYRKDLDLRATVPVLAQVYRTDPESRFRLAAVAALHAIGDEEGMLAVRSNLMKQTDERVQTTSILVLHDFYGPSTFSKSPEIAELAKELLEMKEQRGAIASR